MHKCDNRKCVNPEHLSIGTHKENMRDMARKGRAPRGRPTGVVPHSKISYDDVLDIRKKYESGDVAYKTLANQYGITVGHTKDIVKMRKWKRPPFGWTPKAPSVKPIKVVDNSWRVW